MSVFTQYAISFFEIRDPFKSPIQALCLQHSLQGDNVLGKVMLFQQIVTLNMFFCKYSRCLVSCEV